MALNINSVFTVLMFISCIECSFISLGTLVSWKPPTDGACYDESCICYHQLGILEIAITYVVVAIGIIVSIALVIFNTAKRSNK